MLSLRLRKCISTFITCKYFICQNDVDKKNRDHSDENFGTDTEASEHQEDVSTDADEENP